MTDSKKIDLGSKHYPKDLPRVYVAGPYSGGDWGENIQNAVNAGERLWNNGFAPFIPHTHTALWSTIYPKENGEWLIMDLYWLDVCDALVRLDGESPGADLEITYAKNIGIPVFESVDELIEELGE